MKQIICFGDSNTYGYIPGTGKRYPWGIRWTSILNEKLGFENVFIQELDSSSEEFVPDFDLSGV